ncbi:hypothetical protein FOL47_003397 [Perkinsus chesapeaki]|uniref:CCHC-type domain-containing protein n=1 Tax=Perkinsus chesapeaki TaxID=330153 RepID=A0A7J6KML0_PERCH|nr:hypothetical protein FOL47_003397 [Perkinsus chesapeaki]
MIGDFIMVEKDVEEAGRVAYDEYKQLDASDEIAEKASSAARESAAAHNKLVQALKANGSGKSASSPSSMAPNDSNIVVQVMQSPVPERYDGISDIEDWFRRYEADARGAGWTELQMAERLGNHLRGVYFDVWHQNCTKTDFIKDRDELIGMFALTQPDEVLARFNSLTWDRTTKVVAFVTSLRRYIKAYNETLSEDEKLSENVMNKMVMDRLIANAPNAVKSVLRRRRPTTVKETCQIFDDYKERPSVTSVDKLQAAAGMTTDYASVTSSSSNDQLLQAINTLLASQNAMMAVYDNLRKLGGSGRDFSSAQNGSCDWSPPKCIICSGNHSVSTCPYKKYDSGCFVCSSVDHIVRDCPQLPALVKSIAPKTDGSSGNC